MIIILNSRNCCVKVGFEIKYMHEILNIQVHLYSCVWFSAFTTLFQLCLLLLMPVPCLIVFNVACVTIH